MYIVMITNTVKAGSEEAYKKGSAAFMEEMKTVEGCLNTQVWQNSTDSCEIVNVLVWQSEEAAKADDGSVFMKHKPQLRPHFVTNTVQTYTLCE